MQRVRLTTLNDFAEWRRVARGLLLRGIHPAEIVWEHPATPEDLFTEPEDRPPEIPGRAVGIVPPRFLDLAAEVICNRAPERFALLYRVLFRLQKDRLLLEARDDPDIARMWRLAGEVREDGKRLLAYVRFGGDDARFVSWYEPDNYILERTAPWLVDRHRERQWALLTPYRSVVWDGTRLTYGHGSLPREAPRRQASEAEWRRFFARLFPSGDVAERISQAAHGNPMPARVISSSMEDVPMTASKASDLAEAENLQSLAEARAAVQGCTRCPLYLTATQAVFGEGPKAAEVMFVGEQPGDQEDQQGRPFVGPAGQVLDAALETVGIDRRRVYVTNAVKHFKFTPRGKRRIHQRPNAGEIQACRFWLDLERAFVQPKLVVALGATAAQSLLGKAATLSSLRGRKLELPDGGTLLVTAHPSYLLRLPDRDRAAEETQRFEADLRAVKAFIDRRGDEVRSGGPLAA